MRVKALLFARLRDVAGVSEWTCDISKKATVADVWRILVDTHPSLEPFGTSVSCAVNASFAKMTSLLNEVDEVAFLPPVSGGCEFNR